MVNLANKLTLSFMVILALFVSACTPLPTSPDPGMALIVRTQVKGQGYYAAGEIVGVTAVADGRTYSYPDLPSRLQVLPGKYVVRHLCYLSAEGRPNEIIQKKIGLASVEEVSLAAGDVLYVKTEFSRKALIAPNGTFVGYLPSCTHDLYMTNPDIKQERNYL